MSDVYSDAFQGYEDYYHELTRLGNEKNESVIDSAHQRAETITKFLELDLNEKLIYDKKGDRISYYAAFGMLFLSLVTREPGFAVIGIGFTLNPLLGYVEHEIPEETKRYMYAKFMMDSVGSRRT